MFNNKIKENIKALEKKTRELEQENSSIRAVLQKLCKHADVDYVRHDAFNYIRHYKKCSICGNYEKISEDMYNKGIEKLAYDKAKKTIKEYKYKNGIGV